MLSLLTKLRRREDDAAAAGDDRDLIALVNEARNDVQRERAIRASRARAAQRRARR